MLLIDDLYAKKCHTLEMFYQQNIKNGGKIHIFYSQGGAMRNKYTYRLRLTTTAVMMMMVATITEAAAPPVAMTTVLVSPV